MKNITTHLYLISVFLFLLIINIPLLFAQDDIAALVENKDINKILKEADAYYKEGKKKLAINLYQYIEKNKEEQDDFDFLWKLGNAYLNSIDKYKSLEYFLLINSKKPNYHPNLKLKIGQSYQYIYDYETALKFFKEYKAETKNKSFAFVDKKIQECNWGLQLNKNKNTAITVTAVNTPVNSEFHDYGPKITPDGLQMIFTSRRGNSTGGKLYYDGNYFEDIFITKRLVTGGWEYPSLLGSNVNKDGHEAAVAISPNGQSVLVYKGVREGDIFITTLKNGQWTVPKSLGNNINSKYRESTATFGDNGKTIIFSSNRPGGIGKLDLWISTMNSDSVWSKPKNLGSTINTSSDEESPFLTVDESTLYFSSNGHQGLGNYDIFKSIKNGNNWGVPINMATPINSPTNDLYFVITSDYSRGYFSSTRPEGIGGYDIYEIRFDGVQDLADTKTIEEPVEEDPIVEEHVDFGTVTFTPLNSINGILELINEENVSDNLKNDLLIEIKEIIDEENETVDEQDIIDVKK